MRCLSAVLILPVVALCAAACTEGLSCTDIGAGSGVSFELPRDLYRQGRTVDVRLCQTGKCDAASGDLYQVMADGAVEASVDFPGFASTFSDGDADVVVVVREGRRPVDTLESTVTLTRVFPNGRDCDGEYGYLSGNADLAQGGTP